MGGRSFREGGPHERALPLVIDAMREHGTRRLVVVSGAGVDAPA
ncbi:MAG: SDR family oxidoreductase [Actinomycetota bacterium]|nr:SDR family oxidoreductase [Actinomycetota bacterium]